MQNSFFTPEDFKILADYGGKEVNDYPKSAYVQMKSVYDKLGMVADEMKQYGYSVHCKKHPLSPSKKSKFKTYFWAQLYPADYPDAQNQVMFNIAVNKDGFVMAVDRKRSNDTLPDNVEANRINKNSLKTISIEDGICNFSKEEIVDKIKAFCSNDSNKRSFLEIGSIYNVKGCLEELNKLRMEEYKNLLLSNRNLILTGAPGTGKTYLAKKIAEELDATADNERLGFVQFHPSYDYTDFVEGLRPIKKGETIGFEREDGIFMKFCRKALNSLTEHKAKDENKGKDEKEVIKTAPKYVFIIDEINRGEMSKILGELFFSIDPGYRGEKGKVATQYSNLWKYTDKDGKEQDLKFGESDKFYVPENVYIIGTMNDIDRSVESMDFAMRRRFAFKEVKAEDRQNMIDECEGLNKDMAQEIKTRMDNLNKAIDDAQLGSAYHIGGAYFLKLKNYLNSADPWKDLWDNHLQGLIFEYFRGQPDQKTKMDEIYAAYNGQSKQEKK